MNSSDQSCLIGVVEREYLPGQGCCSAFKGLLYFFEEKKVFVPAVKGYYSACSHVFTLTGVDIAVSKTILMLFHNFCLPCEV